MKRELSYKGVGDSSPQILQYIPKTVSFLNSQNTQVLTSNKVSERRERSSYFYIPIYLIFLHQGMQPPRYEVISKPMSANMYTY